MIGLVPPEIIALVGAIVAGGVLLALVVFFARSSAISKDDLEEARAIAEARREAERAEREDEEENRDL